MDNKDKDDKGVNPAVTKEQVEELNDLMAKSLELGEERAATIKKTGEDVAEIIQKQEDIKEEFSTKFLAMEAQVEKAEKQSEKIAELETTIAKMEMTGSKEEDGLDQKAVDLYNITRKSFMPNARDVTLEEAKELETVYMHAICGKIHLLTQEQKNLVNTIIDPDGGFVTAPTFDQTIINKKFDLRGVMDLVTIKNTVTGEYKQAVDFSDYDKSEYLNELANGVSDDHTPDYKLITWNTTEQIFKLLITRSEIEDAFIQGGVDNDILGKMRLGAMRQTGAQILIGNGVDRPRGIFTYPDGTAFGEIERITSFASLSISWEDVIALLPRELKDPYHDSAAYAMNRRSFFDLLVDKDSTGQLKLMNQINFFNADGVNITIMGKPVRFDAGIADSGTTDNEAVIFGDFKEAYVLCERIGFSVIIDNVTSGQVVTYRLRRRNDGRLRMGDALKILKIKA